jgi:hypothetical protein
MARLVHFGAAGRSGGDDSKARSAGPEGRRHRSMREISMAPATMVDSTATHTGDFLTDVMRAADVIDSRLRRSLTPQQYAMVQDLVLATRITTIARDALGDRAEPTVAA